MSWWRIYRLSKLKKKCREKLVNVLVGECSENIDQNDNNNNRH